MLMQKKIILNVDNRLAWPPSAEVSVFTASTRLAIVLGSTTFTEKVDGWAKRCGVNEGTGEAGSQTVSIEKYSV